MSDAGRLAAPGVTHLPIRAGASDFYNFRVLPAGTHWMHSHQGLQEAFLPEAPLIVHDPADHKRDQQEIVIMLSDFSFTRPGPGKPNALIPPGSGVQFQAVLEYDSVRLSRGPTNLATFVF
jgi:FtsP/CotA-like multicopper oxidase with cupredoxin domain